MNSIQFFVLPAAAATWQSWVLSLEKNPVWQLPGAIFAGVMQHMMKVGGFWSCMTCVQNFRDKTDCRRHVEAKHVQLKFKCRNCNYVARTTHALRKHELTRHDATKKYEINLSNV